MQPKNFKNFQHRPIQNSSDPQPAVFGAASQIALMLSCCSLTFLCSLSTFFCSLAITSSNLAILSWNFLISILYIATFSALLFENKPAQASGIMSNRRTNINRIPTQEKEQEERTKERAKERTVDKIGDNKNCMQIKTSDFRKKNFNLFFVFGTDNCN